MANVSTKAAGEPPPPRRPRWPGAALALVLLLALGIALAVAAIWRARAPVAGPQAPAAALPADYAPFFDALAARFPAESQQIRENFTPADPISAPDAYLAAALKHLRQTRGVVAAQADAAAMTGVFEAQAAMIAALRGVDAKLCVDFVYGGATDAFMAFVATRRPLFAALARASLDAVLDGAAKRHARDAPGDEDFAMLESSLRAKGMGDAEIAALLDGKTPDPPLPDERMCEAAQAYVAAALALPEPARSRVLSLAIELMARS